MARALPPSLDRTLHSVHDEVAFARSLTPEERLVVVARVCRAAGQLLAMHPKRDRVLAMQDELPPSTVAALARLRLRLRRT